MRNDHTDAELARREHEAEMGVISNDENRWFAWVDRAERLLGLDSLDGDAVEDGYSLDDAHDRFEAGMPAEDYAREVRLAWQGKGL